MDDQTEVPERYVVLYTKDGEEKGTEPESYEEARDRAGCMSQEEGVHVLSVMSERGYLLHVAQAHQQAQKEQVDQDVDASLEEPAIGAFSAFPDEPTSEQLDDWEKELESSEPAKAAVSSGWNREHNRHIALEHAMKLATIPMGGMVVQTSGPDAEHVVKNARVFLAFLNEEGAGA